MDVNYCNQNNIAQSVSRKGNCWDNAVMDHFFRGLQSFENHYAELEKVA